MIELSVVLVVGQRRDRAVGALASVLSQDAVDRLEVLLCDTAADAPPLLGSDHPAVRTLRLPGALFAAAKTRGVREARSPVVAFLEEHARALPGWAAALIAAHRGPWAGVGGEVHNGNPGFAGSRAAALMNYHPWLPPAPRGEFRMLPGHNSSWKRDVLLSYGDRLEELLRAEVALHLCLHRDGHRLLLEPAARFQHINESGLASMARGYFLWNRLYGIERARAFGWSRRRRAFYVIATPLIPLYFLARLQLILARRRPHLLGRSWIAAPRILFAQLAAAAGQAAGLLFGPGDAEARFSDYEMNVFRPMDGTTT